MKTTLFSLDPLCDAGATSLQRNEKNTSHY